MGLSVTFESTLEKIDPDQWNNLLTKSDNPFISYAFLRGLEDSNCVGTEESGWLPQHVCLWQDGSLVAGMPCYVKLHSYGEYIFDWAWARAAHQATIGYYPKLVSAAPFTPVTGRRILMGAHAPKDAREILIQGLLKLQSVTKASSTHILFETEHETQLLEKHEFLTRLSYQFHWRNNREWTSFDSFLSSLRSSNRKQIKRERNKAQSQVTRIITKTGQEITPKEWDALYDFYLSTVRAHRATPYLNREFFEWLSVSQKETNNVVSFLAFKKEEIVAGVLCFRSEECLYGRYWGSYLELDAMHFELCYYSPIEWCIENGITYFEAGAQGTHKIKRGLLPRSCYSSHYISNTQLRRGVAQYIQYEKQEIEHQMRKYSEHSPFKKNLC
ncbi:MAG: GNAT family N-acetyltransferase [Myxococcota bacterium]|nr:GNAT family N-acetyltransferase [Myxococcota bacterium]